MNACLQVQRKLFERISDLLEIRIAVSGIADLLTEVKYCILSSILLYGIVSGELCRCLLTVLRFASK